MAKLFTAFGKLQDSHNLNPSGCGVGLVLSKRICEEMGGRIGVRSEVGTGTTFWFEIPVMALKEPVSKSSDFDLGSSIAREDLSSTTSSHCEFSSCLISTTNLSFSQTGHLHSESQAGYASSSSQSCIPSEGDRSGSRLVTVCPPVRVGKKLTPLRVCASPVPSVTDSADLFQSSPSFVTDCSPALQSNHNTLSSKTRDHTEVDFCPTPPSATSTITSTRDFSEISPCVSSSHHSTTKLYTVFVVDDNDFSVIVMQNMLEGTPFEVVAYSNGKELIDSFLEFNKSFSQGLTLPLIAILMDYNMPVMDGLEATKAIRQMELRFGWHRLPVFGISASHEPEEQQRGLDAGMDQNILKPFSKSKLLSALHECARRQQDVF